LHLNFCSKTYGLNFLVQNRKNALLYGDFSDTLYIFYLQTSQERPDSLELISDAADMKQFVCLMTSEENWSRCEL